MSHAFDGAFLGDELRALIRALFKLADPEPSRPPADAVVTFVVHPPTDKD